MRSDPSWPVFARLGVGGMCSMSTIGPNRRPSSTVPAMASLARMSAGRCFPDGARGAAAELDRLREWPRVWIPPHRHALGREQATAGPPEPDRRARESVIGPAESSRRKPPSAYLYDLSGAGVVVRDIGPVAGQRNTRERAGGEPAKVARKCLGPSLVSMPIGEPDRVTLRRRCTFFVGAGSFPVVSHPMCSCA